jgi:hypothetical protein
LFIFPNPKTWAFSTDYFPATAAANPPTKNSPKWPKRREEHKYRPQICAFPPMASLSQLAQIATQSIHSTWTECPIRQPKWNEMVMVVGQMELECGQTTALQVSLKHPWKKERINSFNNSIDMVGIFRVWRWISRNPFISFRSESFLFALLPYRQTICSNKKEGNAWTTRRQKAADTKRKKSKATDEKFRP